MNGDLRLKGTVVRWCDERRFGIVRQQGSTRQFFLSAAEWPTEDAPSTGTIIRFETEPSRSPGGLDRAVRISLADQSSRCLR